eukprot:350275-Chlamydomonas_euryale.AAC.4
MPSMSDAALNENSSWRVCLPNCVTRQWAATAAQRVWGWPRVVAAAAAGIGRVSGWVVKGWLLRRLGQLG